MFRSCLSEHFLTFSKQVVINLLEIIEIHSLIRAIKLIGVSSRVFYIKQILTIYRYHDKSFFVFVRYHFVGIIIFGFGNFGLEDSIDETQKSQHAEHVIRLYTGYCHYPLVMGSIQQGGR
jgi:hypothetical protein